MAAVHNGHINILRKLIKLGYTDKKAITSITIQDVLKMNVSKGEMRSICELMDAIRDNDLLTFFIDSKAVEADVTANISLLPMACQFGQTI